VKSKTGVSLEELRLDRVVSGWGDMADFSIAPETLRHQAGIADAAGRRQLAENLRRAAELVHVPDAVILDIYNALRPYRSKAAELEAMAQRLRIEFSAPACARWVEEALEVYASRGLLHD
jgi:propanediol dehydratase small subunit